MRMLAIAISGMFVVGGVFVIGGFLIPSKWDVTSSVVIHASPERIYPLVSNFKEWEKWSPWNASKDATLEYVYSGPESGVDARQDWTSKKMGSGWMELTSARPQKGIAYDLHINTNQTQSTLYGSIIFAPADGGTKVIWTDKGDSGKNIINRWMSLMIKLMLKKDIDKGLSGLKARAEKGVHVVSMLDSERYELIPQQ